MIKNIEIGKTYVYFDDGKITESRKQNVVITDIIPFANIDSDTLIEWGVECTECHWLYAEKTDYFIKGTLDTDGHDEIVFVRTIDDGWFSLGWWAGRLDWDGSLTKSL